MNRKVLSLRTEDMIRVVVWIVLVFLRLPCEVCSTCPSAPPCLCLQGVIDCSGHELNTIAYIKYQQSENYHTLTYSNNRLTTITARVFSNLNVTRILLENNNISVIEEAAFLGIEGVLLEINLSNNNLKILPKSLGYLRALTTLDISGNPLDGERRGIPHVTIDDFVSAVMRELGNTVTSITFGDRNTLSHWPESMHHLVHLRRLFLTGSTINYFKTGWFRGFQKTLTTLSIKDSALVQVPVDLADLSQLTELFIEHNRYEDGNTMLIKSPFIGIGDTLTVLSLKYDNITTFPDVIRYLTKLQNLTLDGNSLVFISEEAVRIMGNSSLEYLSLRNCGLKRIPGAISELNQLLQLDLSDNFIKTIESPDIVKMRSLNVLTLSNNPLCWISRFAFQGLFSLTRLDLSRSDLTVIPQAIQHIFYLHVLDLTDSRIDCTCDMFWVKRWIDLYKKNLTIYGECETIEQSVDNYINYRLPTCPRFVELIE